MSDTIYETFIKEICSICKNREKDLCHIVYKIDGTLGCEFYEKACEVEGYKEPVQKQSRWFYD